MQVSSNSKRFHFWSLPALHIQNNCQIAAVMSMNFNFTNLLNFIFGGFLTFGTTVRRTLVAKQKCNLRSTHSVVYAEGF